MRVPRIFLSGHWGDAMTGFFFPGDGVQIPVLVFKAGMEPPTPHPPPTPSLDPCMKFIFRKVVGIIIRGIC